MKILIHDERLDSPEFLFETMVTRGYNAGFARNGSEIITMLLNDQYNVVLTNGVYRELNPEQYARLKSSSVFIIAITASHDHDMALNADLYLLRPFLISELWRALEKPLQ